MRATPNRIWPWTITRATLTRLAPLLAMCEQADANESLAVLIAELESLRSGDATAEVWRQATADLSGPESYGLERIGLWPDE